MSDRRLPNHAARHALTVGCLGLAAWLTGCAPMSLNGDTAQADVAASPASAALAASSATEADSPQGDAAPAANAQADQPQDNAASGSDAGAATAESDASPDADEESLPDASPDAEEEAELPPDDEAAPEAEAEPESPPPEADTAPSADAASQPDVDIAPDDESAPGAQTEAAPAAAATMTSAVPVPQAALSVPQAAAAPSVSVSVSSDAAAQLTALVVRAMPMGLVFQNFLDRDPQWPLENKAPRASAAQLQCLRQRLSPEGFQDDRRQAVNDFIAHHPDQTRDAIDVLSHGAADVMASAMQAGIQRERTGRGAQFEEATRDFTPEQMRRFGDLNQNARYKVLRQSLLVDINDKNGATTFITHLFLKAMDRCHVPMSVIQ